MGCCMYSNQTAASVLHQQSSSSAHMAPSSQPPTRSGSRKKRLSNACKLWIHMQLIPDGLYIEGQPLCQDKIPGDCQNKTAGPSLSGPDATRGEAVLCSNEPSQLGLSTQQAGSPTSLQDKAVLCSNEASPQEALANNL